MNQTFDTLAQIVETFPARGDRDAARMFTGFRIRRYSYAQFHRHILQCAGFLRSRGVERGDRIILWSPNRYEWAVVFGACVVSGVVLIPLDARNTLDFAIRVANETEAKLLIRPMAKRADGVPAESFLIENLLETINDAQPLEPLPDIRAEDLAEIIYTSGTTGDPKGVMLSQGNLASNVSTVRRVIQTDETYHLLSVLPLSHALEQTGGFWTPLAGGGSVTYLSVLKPSAIFEVFQREACTVMVLVPRLLDLFKQRIEKTLRDKGMEGYLKRGRNFPAWVPRWFRKLYFLPIHKRFNTRFHLFVSGGAALDPKVEQFWRNLGFNIIQGYGLTETSPVLTVGRVERPILGSVGRAVDGVKLELGPDNEIRVQGPNVFSGYYKKPVETQAVFDGGWLKTGDVGEIDGDGFVFIKSRKKDIIVTPDGVNVYPEDIERALNALPGVKESCVLGVGESQDLVHAVLLLNNPPASLDDIVRQANQSLSPEQQIQSAGIWPLSEFPKTTTMKIKKNEVREQIQIENSAAVPAVDATPLRAILADLARMEPTDIADGQRLGADLGLSSMDRVELIMRVEEEFRLDLEDDAVTAETTVAGAQALIDARAGIQNELPFRRWTRSAWCHAIRAVFHWGFLRPLIWRYCRVESHGLEHVENLEGPHLFVCNHTSHVDTGLILTLPPWRVASRICPAAFKEYFDADGASALGKWIKWLEWNLATMGVNIFPFPQTSGYRRSMVYAGELVDEGWSILFFPEGRRTDDGNLNEFLNGVGMLAPELDIPIVPVAVVGGETIMHHNDAWPHPGSVKIKFGKPFLPPRGSAAEITLHVKAKIVELWNELKGE